MKLRNMKMSGIMAIGLIFAFNNIGNSAEIATVNGFGNNIPLSVAIEQIVPSDLRVVYDQGVNTTSQVSWRGGADWKAVLERTLSGKNLSVSYNGNIVKIYDRDKAYDGGGAIVRTPSNNVSLGGGGSQRNGGLVIIRDNTPPPSAPAVIVETPAEPRRTISPTTTITSITESVKAPVTAMWRAKTGATLQQVLNEWADKAGWHIVQNSKMIYELQSGADFDGDFIQASTALVKSVHASPHPTATFYKGNNTLVISDSSETN